MIDWLIFVFGFLRNCWGIDVYVMVDVIVVVMLMEDKEFYKVGELVVVVMIEIVSVIIGDLYKVSMVVEEKKLVNKVLIIFVF